MIHVPWPRPRKRWYWRFLRPGHEHDWLWFNTTLGPTGFATCRRCGLFGEPDRPEP